MLIAALSVAYGLIGFGIGCRVATLAAWHMVAEHNQRYGYKQQSSPDGDKWFGGAVLGLLCLPVWPLVLMAAAMRGVLFAPPRDVQLQRQAKKIKELERELELGE